MADNLPNEIYGPYMPSAIREAKLESFRDSEDILVNVRLLAVVASYSPERVSLGYCCAYTTNFEECGLRFSIPEILLTTLARIQIAYSQIGLGLVRYSTSS